MNKYDWLLRAAAHNPNGLYCVKTEARRLEAVLYCKKRKMPVPRMMVADTGRIYEGRRTVKHTFLRWFGAAFMLGMIFLIVYLLWVYCTYGSLWGWIS